MLIKARKLKMVFGNKYMFDLFEELKDCSEVKINNQVFFHQRTKKLFWYRDNNNNPKTINMKKMFLYLIKNKNHQI